jgi:hypothetical protein
MLCWSAWVEPRLATAAVRAVEGTEAFGIRGEVLMDECSKDHEPGFESLSSEGYNKPDIS